MDIYLIPLDMDGWDAGGGFDFGQRFGLDTHHCILSKTYCYTTHN
jgi:hypothetical protein